MVRLGRAPSLTMTRVRRPEGGHPAFGLRILSGWRMIPHPPERPRSSMPMRYSERRLRRVLALTRMTVGLVYVCYGYEKLFDASFFENGFLQRLSYWQTTVAPWYAWVWQMLATHPSRWAVFFGTVEMFLGVALLLGLATRPACALGILYTLHRFALGWYPDDAFEMWRFLELHLEQIAMMGLFLLMIVGHAGDVWGLGAIYHRVRLRLRPVRKTYEQFGEFEAEEEIVSAGLQPIAKNRAS
jgi:uncharacterized membrane protein YphA (DoxX/SURF4 family)